MQNYILTLQELNGLVLKFKGEYYQLMITDEYDVSFELFFKGTKATSEEASEILDFIYNERVKNECR